LTPKIKTRQIEHSEFIRLLCGESFWQWSRADFRHCPSFLFNRVVAVMG